MKNKKKKSSGRPKVSPPSLPDDAMIEILSRVPADDASSFKAVCQKWESLISAEYFMNLHFKNSNSPVILVQEKVYGHGFHLNLIDKWEPPRKNTRLRKCRPGSVLTTDIKRGSFIFSCDGFIVVRCYGYYENVMICFIIFNPITKDRVKVIFNPIINYVEIMAMFFHPLIKEYCTLWRLSGDDLKVEFKMLILGSQPIWKDLKPPPVLLVPNCWLWAPVVIDKDATLYWIVGSRPWEKIIMAFDIRTEEFSLMPHPGPKDHCDSKYENMRILKIDGHLSLVQTTFGINSFVIDIWSLKDYATRLWIKSDSVSIDTNLFVSIVSWTDDYFKVMAVVNGELMLQYETKDGPSRMYGCNLKVGTVRKIGRTFRDGCYMSIYEPSFVSLRNCKSEIRL